MTKIALFPGCFDPFHRQHQKIVEKALIQFELDQIWILINQKSEEKEVLASFQHRYNIIQNLFADHFQVKVWSKPISYYTTYLVRKIKKYYPNTRFYLILGSDQVNNLNQWKHIDNLEEIVKIICAPRSQHLPDSSIIKKYSVCTLKDFTINNFNSQNVKQGWNWSFLQPQTVKYIYKHQLYFQNILKTHFNNHESKLKHSYAVAKLVLQLGKKFNYDQKLDFLYTGALFHDLTKFWTTDEHLNFWQKHNLDTAQLHNNPFPVWHAYTSAYYLEKEMLIQDDATFKAMFYHTTGHVNMSTCAKLLFIADKLEPNKKTIFFVNARKQLQQKNTTLETLFQMCVEGVYQEIRAKKLTPNKDTKALYAQYFEN